jgi:N-acetyl-gamma-glutamyl-phosphate reductase
MYKVFIDGEAGTTGLQIRDRLGARPDIELVSIPDHLRKDGAARRERLNAADAVILCLPDEAARESVSLIESPSVKVIDASTAHRTASDWAYGFAEMGKDARADLATATRIANPGCYPTGFIALVKPLVDAGLIPRDWPLSCNAVSGYTGGGKSMIAEFTDAGAANHTLAAFRTYANTLKHKHIPEMKLRAGLTRRPIFAPAVGRYAQGMIVEVPLHLDALPGAPTIGPRGADRGIRRRTFRRGCFARRGAGRAASRSRGAERDQPDEAVRLRRRNRGAGASRRSAGQPRQGCGRRGGAEPQYRARASRGDGSDQRNVSGSG